MVSISVSATSLWIKIYGDSYWLTTHLVSGLYPWFCGTNRLNPLFKNSGELSHFGFVGSSPPSRNLHKFWPNWKVDPLNSPVFNEAGHQRHLGISHGNYSYIFAFYLYLHIYIYIHTHIYIYIRGGQQMLITHWWLAVISPFYRNYMDPKNAGALIHILAPPFCCFLVFFFFRS